MSILLLSLAVDVRELTARADIKRWSQCVRSDITEFSTFDALRMRLDRSWPPTEAEEALNIKVAHAVDSIWSDSAHWYKAVASSDLPADLRQAIESSLDTEVREIVRNLRNITEHWDENRRHFEDSSLPKPSKSVRWYQIQGLVNGPWSFTWSIDRGYELGQVLALDRLIGEIEKVDSLLGLSTQKSAATQA